MVKKVFGGKSKEVVRDHVESLIRNYMTIFSLPYLNFQIESKAKLAICAEREEGIYKKQLKKAPSNCVLHNCKASEIIGQYTYNFVSLDFCGSISQELFDCLSRVRLRKNGKLIITLLKAREHPKWKHLIGKDRIISYKNLLKKYGFHLYKTVEYMDTSPMIVLFADENQHNSIDQYKIA